TIIWNGPMGKFEDKNFSFGTKEIAKAVAKKSKCSIIGGGDTIAALRQFGYLNKISYVCTGGGAMLEFLAGKKLPGLEVLK
ncbi:MAG: phosphoglycerate kinase, partial [Candidatus Andersenbacteria bacterium]|nr:phosphoglycerate kinase [Candidatus Andersenbacteria bacterium]